MYKHQTRAHERIHEPQDDRQKHHQHRQQYGRQYTLNNANDRTWQLIEPGEPRVFHAECMDVGDDTDESNCVNG